MSMDSFYPSPMTVPGGLTTDAFVLEPLTPDHVEVDYQAVMATRSKLRVWGGTSWPTDDFDLAGNLADLEMHHREHGQRDAFTYTVLNPDRSECLGCVYITPLQRLVVANPDLRAGPHDAVVGFWAASTVAGEAIRIGLARTLRRWLVDAWAFTSVRFAVRSGLAEQLDLLTDLGLSEESRVAVPGRTGEFALFPVS